MKQNKSIQSSANQTSRTKRTGPVRPAQPIGLTKQQLRNFIRRHKLPIAQMRRFRGRELERVAITEGGILFPGLIVDLGHLHYHRAPPSPNVAFFLEQFRPYQGIEKQSCVKYPLGHLAMQFGMKFGRDCHSDFGAITQAAWISGFEVVFRQSVAPSAYIPKTLLREVFACPFYWRKVHRLPVVEVYVDADGIGRVISGDDQASQLRTVASEV